MITLLVLTGLESSCVATALVGGTAATVSAVKDERSLGEHFDDVKLSAQVDARLIAEQDMPSRWVSIEVVKGVVYFTGYLPSRNHIDRAMAITRTIDGVRDTHSELQIGEPKVSEYFSGSYITAKVKAKLLNDPVVSGLTIHISTTNSRVYLQGVVSNDIQRVRAKELALDVEGVTAVIDLLRMTDNR
ncbi:MAG: BON domain-containing protein [Mariprofundales bacterium]